MRLKSYFAASVESAMAQASRELGPDAMFVNSRKAPAEARKYGEYEVVFAIDPEHERQQNTIAPPKKDETASRPARPAAADESSLSSEIGELRRQIENLAASFNRAAKLNSATASSPALEKLVAHLAAAGTEPVVLDRILTGIMGRSEAPSSAATWKSAVTQEIAGAIQIDSRIDSSVNDAAVIAVVGPPGCGKTSTIVKLAVEHGIAARRRVRLISLDTVRIGGADQLQTYASLIGASFTAVDTVESLVDVVERAEPGELLLVDTPGFSAAVEDLAMEMASWIRRLPTIEVHLVLPAAVRSADLERAARRFEAFRPSRLIFTRVDEVEDSASILNIASKLKRPVSFLGTGQRIPEDLAAASSERIAETLISATVFKQLEELVQSTGPNSSVAA